MRRCSSRDWVRTVSWGSDAGTGLRFQSEVAVPTAGGCVVSGASLKAATPVSQGEIGVFTEYAPAAYDARVEIKAVCDYGDSIAQINCSRSFVNDKLSASDCRCRIQRPSLDCQRDAEGWHTRSDWMSIARSPLEQ